MYNHTGETPTSPQRSRQTTFTSTSVPKFAGATSGEQYRQVFDDILLSNGWNDVIAALQLLSHLEGDALNVALLMPTSRRASRVGLVDALSAHYESPGRLADSRKQFFEKITRTAGADPSIFAEQDSCELRRHLDSVSSRLYDKRRGEGESRGWPTGGGRRYYPSGTETVAIITAAFDTHTSGGTAESHSNHFGVGTFDTAPSGEWPTGTAGPDGEVKYNWHGSIVTEFASSRVVYVGAQITICR